MATAITIRRRVETSRQRKSRKSTVKAAAAKQSVTKSSAAAATASPPLIVLGFDDQQKPRGARFVDAKPDLVTKAAEMMGLKVYQATPPEVAEYAKKLPLGRLYANGRGFVPNVRQDLYSDLVVALGLEPQTALSKNGDKDSLPAAVACPGLGARSALAISLLLKSRSITGGGGGTAAKTASMSTTAIGSMIESDAKTGTAESG